MTTQFNHEMYARMKAKKNKPLLSIGQKRPKVDEKEVVETTSSIPVHPKTRVTSPTISPKEITPHQKKTHSGDQGKNKVNANIWEDVAAALGRAYNVITLDKLKGLSRVPFHEPVNHHIHKLVQLSFFPYVFI